MRAVTQLVRRGGAAPAEAVESSAALAVNGGTAFARTLKRRAGVRGHSFLLLPRADLPARGLSHHLVYLHVPHRALPVQPAGAPPLSLPPVEQLRRSVTEVRSGQGQTRARAESEFDSPPGKENAQLPFCIAQVERSWPVDAALAQQLNAQNVRGALGGVTIDHTFELVALNTPLPDSWLHAAVGGKVGGQPVQVLFPPGLCCHPALHYSSR